MTEGVSLPSLMGDSVRELRNLATIVGDSVPSLNFHREEWLHIQSELVRVAAYIERERVRYVQPSGQRASSEELDAEGDLDTGSIATNNVE